MLASMHPFLHSFIKLENKLAIFRVNYCISKNTVHTGKRLRVVRLIFPEEKKIGRLTPLSIFSSAPLFVSFRIEPFFYILKDILFFFRAALEEF